MNPIKAYAPIEPQTLFLGTGSVDKSDKDPFKKRDVSQLNDIEFSDSDDPEEIANLKRQPATVLNEENLKEYLTPETVKLNLENHYWISNSFISKLSKMAPNLRQLSLRRMPQITNQFFAEAFKEL
jgi:hypothetical protein